MTDSETHFNTIDAAKPLFLQSLPSFPARRPRWIMTKVMTKLAGGNL